MEDKINRLEVRIELIEAKIVSHDEKLVDQQTNIAVIGQRLKSIETDVHEMKSGVTWLNRLIIGALILAVLGFVLNGGLAGISG